MTKDREGDPCQALLLGAVTKEEAWLDGTLEELNDVYQRLSTPDNLRESARLMRRALIAIRNVRFGHKKRRS